MTRLEYVIGLSEAIAQGRAAEYRALTQKPDSDAIPDAIQTVDIVALPADELPQEG